ncbi:MAG: ATP-binding protein, partial [Candidatus Aminicenantes bacterium]|nr:ATP-binding protein [Candidatus Aminicenantes bacterium]
FSHFLQDPGNAHSRGHKYIKAIYEDSQGVLWIGTLAGLFQFLEKTNTFIPYKHNPRFPGSLSYNTVSSIMEDQAGNLWIGTEGGGLNRFDRKTKTFIHYRHHPQDPYSLSLDDVGPILEDMNGDIWVGTWNGGVNRFDSDKKIFSHFKHDPNDSNSISNNRVWTLFEDSSGVLWFGTYGGGLNRFDREKETFIRYDTNDGLANDVIYGILEDENGFLWISTNKGISRFNPKAETFTNYDVADGLQSNEFNRGAYFKDQDGWMYFGGINGVSMFHPEQIIDNSFIPQLVITSFKVMNQEVTLDWMVAQKEGIVFPYNLNFFSFEFAALDYTAPEKNQYAYLLEGVDSDWIYCGTRRYAAYTSLNPGNYIFRVKGSNNDGVWNEVGISIPITISPPFWKRWWFTLIWVSLIVMILFLIFYFTFRYITLLKEKARAERFAAVGKFASYFAHDIKSPLEGTYLIASQMREMLSSGGEKREYLDDVIGGIDRMRNLVKGALDFSRASKPRMEPNDLNLLIQNVASEFKEINSCEISLQMEKELPLILLDSSLMKRVFMNLFENSFQARKDRCLIKVSTGIKDKKILVEVKDNGKGIRKEMIAKIFEPFSSDKEKGHGFGLAFVKETIKSHGGTIKVKSEVDQGTTFFIMFPIIYGEKKKR